MELLADELLGKRAFELGEHGVAVHYACGVEPAHGAEQPHVNKKHFERLVVGISGKRQSGLRHARHAADQPRLRKPDERLLEILRPRAFADAAEHELLVLLGKVGRDGLPRLQHPGVQAHGHVLGEVSLIVFLP